MTDAEALGMILRRLRGRMSQEAAGYEIGFTQHKMSDLETKGINQVSDLSAIAEYYRLKVSELMQMAEEEKAKDHRS